MLIGINLIIFKLFLGGVIGAIVGLEREKNIQDTKEQSPIGVRTNVLIGILGGVALYLSQIVNDWVFIICFAAVSALVFYPLTKKHTDDAKLMSYKTSISSIIVFLMGALAFSGEIQVALAVAVITTFVISLKATLHNIIYGISYDELMDGIKFVIIAFIILPFLPNQGFDHNILQLIDPSAFASTIDTDIINPYRIWLLIVIISGLNFLGYVLVRLFGKGKGYSLTGFIGGFYSSTVTSLNLSSVSKKQTDIVYPFVAGILLACGTSFFKMIVLIRTLSQPLFDKLFPGMIAMCVYLLASGTFFHFYGEKKAKSKTKLKQSNKKNGELISLKSPLNLLSAVKLAGFVVLTMLAANLILNYADINWYYILAGLMAFFAVDDPIIISTADIAGKSITYDAAKNIILGVIFLNFLQKLATAYFFGNKKLVKPLSVGLVGLLLVTILSLLYL
jgi:uncharacterized membrane protein (DUF4010 family)